VDETVDETVDGTVDEIHAPPVLAVVIRWTR
jgi:hypothetical protein